MFQRESEEISITIDQVHEFINNLKQRTLDGHQDGIVSYAILLDIEKNSKLSKDEVKVVALEEADNYSEKSFEHKGLYVERRNGAARWDFKGIAEYETFKIEEKSLVNELKARHALYLKGRISYDEETGEQLPIPSVKYSEDSIIIKHK